MNSEPPTVIPRRAEEELRKANAELLRTNQELERFAWSVSHDLRTPLRAVSGFLEIFREENESKLDARAREMLDRVDSGVDRMTELIDGLVQMSNVRRAELLRESVDLSALAHRVVSDLRSVHPGRSVETRIQPGLVVQADRALAALVLENLIGNAWKFTGKTSSACIDVGQGRMPEGGDCWFVRDNGAGFDAAASPGLFLPFERFHKREEFEGSGLGLATVHRIIHRHGGKIRVESAPGKGALFSFTFGP